MQRNSKARQRWNWLLGLLSLAMLVGACSSGPTEIGVGLPDANSATGAFLLDTVTVRASTVLRDSVITSSSAYLLAGRYTDPLLGTITAKSYFRLWPNTSFTPDASLVFDSVVLVLPTKSGDTYRYGDTTKVQTLFAVYPLITPVPDPSATPSYASPRLTPLSLNESRLLNAALPKRRARPNITTLRLRLRDDFGRQLMAAQQTGQLTTVEAFQAFLPGLAVVPGATDNGAIMRFDATSTTAGLYLYYHSPSDAGTAQSASYLLVSSSTATHCYQLTADRSTAAVRNLPTQSLQQVSSALTGERAFIEGGLGLQTRLEFPYLASLRQIGQRVTITQASLVAQVPAPTLTPYTPTPPKLNLFLSNPYNQPLSSTAVTSAEYKPGVSTQTGLDQGTYSWEIATYVQGVLDNTMPNNGLLLASDAVTQPDRVALASQRDPLNKLQLRIYAISLQ